MRFFVILYELNRCIMDRIRLLAQRNAARARELVSALDIEGIWCSIGAEVHLVGSLRMGLLVKHRDIDFHIYSSPLVLSDSFAAMARLAADDRVEEIVCRNLIDTDEKCVEWHAVCRDADGEKWQLDMIHILRGSFYDGYFERMADRISAVMTDEMRDAVMRLKYETPDDEHIAGVNYYRAVIEGGVRDMDSLRRWLSEHDVQGIVEWIP